MIMPVRGKRKKEKKGEKKTKTLPAVKNQIFISYIILYISMSF